MSTKKVWEFLTSPKVVVAANVLGLIVQVIHQVDGYRRGNKKVGFIKGS
jgi:hypothetical protein